MKLPTTESDTIAALQQNAGLLRFIENQTPAICLTAVRYGGYDERGYFLPGYALEFVRPDAQTHDICMAAVCENGNVIRYVRPDLQTHDICLAAVTTDGNALRFVPAEHAGHPDILHAAIKNWGGAIQYVPAEHQTPDLCRLAIQTGSPLVLQWIKELTYDLCLFAVQQDHEFLRGIPGHLLTEELCLAAVRQKGSALMWIPAQRQTPEICRMAVSMDESAHRFVRIPLNRCTQCGTDMGPTNSRQLCGKSYCLNAAMME